MPEIFRLPLDSIRRWIALAVLFSPALLFTLPAVETAAGPNRWTSQGPFGGDITALAVAQEIPAILYAGTRGGGVFKSTDRAANWEKADRGLPAASEVVTIEVDPASPSTAYVALADGSVYKTTNRARRWRWAGTGLPAPDTGSLSPSAGDLKIDPANPSTLYFAHRRDGLFRSLDGGNSWSSVAGLSAIGVRAVAIDPQVGSTLYAATATGVSKSTDSGVTWSVLGGGLAERAYNDVVTSTPAGTVYALGLDFPPGGELFKSTDGGTSWTELSFSGANFLRQLLIDPTDPDTLYAATGSNSNVYKSTDGGATWSSGSDGIRSVIVQSLAIDPAEPSLLYAGTEFDGGVYKSTDGGVVWSPANRGLTNTEVTGLEIDPANPSTVYVGTNAGILKSLDSGTTWTMLDPLITPFGVGSLALDPTRPETVYAGGDAVLFGGGILKTEDGGDQWEVSANIFTVNGSVEDLEIDRSTPSTIYAASGGRVFRSTDDGGSWMEAGGDLPGPAILDLVTAPATPPALYASTIDFGLNGRVSKSLDGGESWFPVNSGLPGNFLLSLAVDPANPETVYTAGLGGVFRTDDGGGQWRPLAAVPGDLGIALAVAPQSPATVYVSTLEGVSKSLDRGGRWFPLDEGLGHAVVDLEVDPIDPAVVHAGTQGGGAYSIRQSTRCEPDVTTLCLDGQPGDRRFEVTLSYDTELGDGRFGDARATALDSLGVTQGGVLSFFDPGNPEVLVKVLNGCGFNDRFWVFYAATTTVGFRLQVTDTVAGVSQVYTNEDLATAAPVTDTVAFPTCDVGRELGAGGPGSALARKPVRLPEAASSIPIVAAPGEDLGGSLGGKIDGVGSCASDPTTLCIDDQPGDRRFRIRATFDTELGGGRAGDGRSIALSALGIDQGGVLWFFDPQNPEILIKVLDGCEFNDRYWVFYAATTTAGFTLTVEDTVAGIVRTFENPDLTAAEPIADTSAFATCDR